jgi:flagellar motor switch protein FliM
MGANVEKSGIKSKIGHSRNNVATIAVKGAAKAWSLALARAARNTMGLELGLSALRQDRLSLAEVLELPPERALVVMLEGPKEGLGLIVLAPEVLAGIVEMQMVGRVSQAASPPRRPTRTDAAMVSGLIDKALTGLEQDLLRDADLVWTSGFRYASFLEDARPLALLLEDVTYQVLRADVDLADGAKSGQIFLALPADGRGRRPAVAETPPSRAVEMVFAAALSEQVMCANAELVAVLARLKLPIDTVLKFKAGDPVFLGNAALDQIDLEGLDGTRVAGGKLGQNRGMRAVRLMEDASAAARVPPPKKEVQLPDIYTEIRKAG